MKAHENSLGKFLKIILKSSLGCDELNSELICKNKGKLLFWP